MFRSTTQGLPQEQTRDLPFSKPLIALLVALHIFGVIGTHSQWMNDMLRQLTPFQQFLDLTPLNLLLTASILVYHYPVKNKGLFIALTVSYLVGYGIEVVGVATGKVFGEYAYGPVLGWQVANVPLMIGVNWMLLVGAICPLVYRLGHNRWQSAAIAATLMVLLDVLIEPVAISLDFWTWFGQPVPLQNYIAWYLVSLPLCWLFFSLNFQKENRAAGWVLGCQVIFFALQQILL
jgi:putative membrane protein